MNTNDTWTSADASSLRTYMRDNPKFKKHLTTYTPKISGDNVEQVALNGARHDGAEKILEGLQSMHDQDTEESKSAFVEEK